MALDTMSWGSFFGIIFMIFYTVMFKWKISDIILFWISVLPTVVILTPIYRKWQTIINNRFVNKNDKK